MKFNKGGFNELKESQFGCSKKVLKVEKQPEKKD